MPTILDVKFGRVFFGWPETLEKQGRKIRYQNSPSKFAEKFAGNFPKIRRTKIKNSPQIRSAQRCERRAINRESIGGAEMTTILSDNNSRILTLP